MTELRHGWTVARLDAAARDAARTTHCFLPWHDRYELARSAAALRLYTDEHPPQYHDLANAGRQAIREEEEALMHHHGWSPPDSDSVVYGGGTATRFVMHWEWAARATPSPETRIVEELAVRQIMKRLTPRQHEAIQALADLDDYQLAAEALAICPSTYDSALRAARQRITALWHEGETPVGRWGFDRRSGGDASRTARRAMALLRRRTGRTRAVRIAPDLVPVHQDARIGWLTVVEPHRPGMERILCRCDCGTEKTFLVRNLRRGLSQSCGCPEGMAAAAARTRAARAAATPVEPAGGHYPRTRAAARAALRRAARDA